MYNLVQKHMGWIEVICGNPANFTQRKTTEKDQIVIGTADIYEARYCNCYEPPAVKRTKGKKEK